MVSGMGVRTRSTESVGGESRRAETNQDDHKVDYTDHGDVDGAEMEQPSMAEALAHADDALPGTDSFDSSNDVYADEFPSLLSMADANLWLTEAYPFESMMDPITDESPTAWSMADADDALPAAESDEFAVDGNDTRTTSLEELDSLSLDMPYYIDDQFSAELDGDPASSAYRAAEFDETTWDAECNEPRLVGSTTKLNRDALTSSSNAAPPARNARSASHEDPEEQGSNECVADAETILAVIRSFGPQVCRGTALQEETGVAERPAFSTSDALATLRDLDRMLTEVQNEIRCLEFDDPTVPTLAVVTARFMDPAPETSNARAENEPSVLHMIDTSALSAHVTRMSREGYTGTESPRARVRDNAGRGGSSVLGSTQREARLSNVRLAADRPTQTRQTESVNSPGILFRLISLVSPCSFAQLVGKSCDQGLEQDQVRGSNRQGVDAAYEKRHPRAWPPREITEAQPPSQGSYTFLTDPWSPWPLGNAIGRRRGEFERQSVSSPN